MYAYIEGKPLKCYKIKCNKVLIKYRVCISEFFNYNGGTIA